MRRQELHPHTASINRTQKIQSKKARHDALQWLAQKFPKAFDNSIKIQPLKIGIMDEILKYSDEAAEFGLSKSKLREAVVIYTRRIDYLTCLKAREMRIDLDGNQAAVVTEEEALKAANKIKKRIEKSLRNARKTSNRKPSTNQTAIPPPFTISHPSERKYLYTTLEAPIINKPPPQIRTKSQRPLDPNAMARIKQRLGIKVKEEEPAVDE